MTYQRVVIDTDAGSDDLLAISYLLTQKYILIEAITVVHGLGYVESSVRNIRRLLHFTGNSNIPVFIGSSVSLINNRSFPMKWRLETKEYGKYFSISNDTILKETDDGDAIEFLTCRLTNVDMPCKILALGPLTNIALTFRMLTSPVVAATELVIMGGAFACNGNVNEDDSRDVAGTLY